MVKCQYGCLFRCSWWVYSYGLVVNSRLYWFGKSLFSLLSVALRSDLVADETSEFTMLSTAGSQVQQYQWRVSLLFNAANTIAMYYLQEHWSIPTILPFKWYASDKIDDFFTEEVTAKGSAMLGGFGCSCCYQTPVQCRCSHPHPTTWLCDHYTLCDSAYMQGVCSTPNRQCMRAYIPQSYWSVRAIG